ncbi:hypothetical protein TYRP_017759, partial [Tyrophagus putrescentiae]
MATGNLTWSFVVPIEDSAFNNCLSKGVYKLAESMGKSTSKGKECTLCHLKFHKKDITKHTDLCKTEASRTRELAERFHTKVKQHAPVHRTGPVTSDVDMVDETSRPSSSSAHDASAHSSGFAASDDLPKVSPAAHDALAHFSGIAASDVLPKVSSTAHDASAHSSRFADSDFLPKVSSAAHGSSSQPNGHLPQITSMEVDAPSVSPLAYGSGSSQLKGQDAREAKMEVDVPSIVSPPGKIIKI